jgi:ubiquinone/menaquinone biosynthesis C-methylase UbiE
MTEIDIKFASFGERWNSRASTWDSEILKNEHYVNFEDGYRKFLDFEKMLLEAYPDSEVGIDLGCGTGVASEALSKKVEQLILLDVAEQMLELALNKFPGAVVLNESATDTSLPDESVDIAVSRGVLISHLPQGEYVNYLNEVYRMLKSGGLFVFDFLNNLTTADYHLSSEKTVFTKQGIEDELEKRGFENIVFDGEESSRVLRVAACKK